MNFCHPSSKPNIFWESGGKGTVRDKRTNKLFSGIIILDGADFLSPVIDGSIIMPHQIFTRNFRLDVCMFVTLIH